MEPSKAIRAGDSVLHKPTGETWVVAAMSPDGTELVCCGWPESIAKVADCELKGRATDDDHYRILSNVAAVCHDQLRGSWAKQNKDATP